jgi:Transposase
MAEVMIGIDPHKSSHTAVAIGRGEEPLGELQVRACPAQAGQLLAWAREWPERAWAIEGAAGLGNLLAQQLVAAGERVLDVPPKLAARVRLLQSGNTSKNDPNDAYSVAVAALRSKAWRPVVAEDHAVVLKIWAKRHRDLARARNQVCCRLHAVLCGTTVVAVPFVVEGWHAPAGRRTREPRPLPRPGRSGRQRRQVPGTGTRPASREQDNLNGVGRIAGQAGSQAPTSRPYHRKTPEVGRCARNRSPHPPCRLSAQVRWAAVRCMPRG